MTEAFTASLLDICKEAGLRYQSNNSKRKTKNNQRWFDHECETEKNNLQSLGKQISRDPNNAQLRTHMHYKQKNV